MSHLSHQDLLTSWESPDGAVRIECRRLKQQFVVRAIRGGNTTGWRVYAGETRAREMFERAVTEVSEGRAAFAPPVMGPPHVVSAPVKRSWAERLRDRIFKLK